MDAGMSDITGIFINLWRV